VVGIDVLPALGHLFTGWSAPFNAQPAAFELTVTGSVSLTANLSPDNTDPDSDGLTNYEELIVYLTVPDDADSDDDLIEDGAEVQQTQTNPLVSQLDAVNYIKANLGSTGPNDTVLARNTVNNTLTLKLKAAGSTTLAAGSWSPLTATSPGVSAGAGSGDFWLQLPGSSDMKRFFRVEGNAPD
jgi:hypothetical protein